MTDHGYASLMDKNRGELARLVGELLRARGMSQVELARAAGISESHVSRILKGEHFPAPEKLGALAEALGVPEEMMHRAYAVSIGLRLEGVKVLNGGVATIIADWPDSSPEARAAALAAAQAVIESFGSRESPE